MRRPRWSRGLVAALLAGCGGGAPADAPAQNPAPPPTIPASARLPEPGSAAVTAPRRTAVVTAVARVAPAVVTVQTESVERMPADPFDLFFGRRPGEQRRAGIGTGFFVREDGVVVTNAHVVAGASRVSVARRDGTTYTARVVGADESNDLAVLKVEARGLPVAPLGNSDSLLVGEWAVAIGNPFGFVLGNAEPSVSAGVISATGRNLVGGGQDGAGASLDMIQTDAAINPGNSGGPLINADGEVIGVNSSIYTPSGGSVGLGFAIPINRARRVVEDLLAHGTVRRPWIGVVLRTPEAATSPRDLLTAGAVVRAIVPGSPAARAGIAAGDQIVRVGTRTVRNPFDWEAALLDLRPGEDVAVAVRRGGRDVASTVRVGDLPEVTAPKVTVLRELQLVTVTAAIRAERRLQASSGALVYQASERVATEIGLEPGDVIVQINQAGITSADDVARALDYYAGRGPMRIFFERQGRYSFTDVILRQ
ncbi:trypsin-like peptidase domain-containing protein [Roseisolibacter sp. H3M3-2]|uniref:trypsin-like peptidase domain-containing protein n=1 Tax=Roseisolibacter sp. H3M3-2 TaxID=3031323 RepID=UPI0023DB85EA|nr:trypsin-like peptidase domain-containing protein [Roseisolibacter sp. H3M3-2]MDF1501525.1 trypsin-like peptidase domain-containing protein [Roseisolibacter sp. H3M3-2]